MLVIKAGILKMLVRIANRQDPVQTASEAVRYGSVLLVYFFFFWQVKILEHLLLYLLFFQFFQCVHFGITNTLFLYSQLNSLLFNLITSIDTSHI